MGLCGRAGAAYQRIRAADPDAAEVAAGLAPSNENSARAMDDRDFLRAMYQAGAAECFDVLAAHDYGYGLLPDDAYGVHDGLNLAHLLVLFHITDPNFSDTSKSHTFGRAHVEA